ncbi:MAG: hypothetical protein ACFFCH_04425 [Promethearchaeota archaeon]
MQSWQATPSNPNIPVVYRVDFPKDQSRYTLSIMVFGIAEMVFVSLVFFDLAILWYLVYFAILLSAIHLILSSQISTRDEWVDTAASIKVG